MSLPPLPSPQPLVHSLYNNQTRSNSGHVTSLLNTIWGPPISLRIKCKLCPSLHLIPLASSHWSGHFSCTACSPYIVLPSEPSMLESPWATVSSFSSPSWSQLKLYFFQKALPVPTQDSALSHKISCFLMFSSTKTWIRLYCNYLLH